MLVVEGADGVEGLVAAGGAHAVLMMTQVANRLTGSCDVGTIWPVVMADYASERERLLASLTQLLRADDRVVGAWLRGSLSGGEADDVSDIDLQVAVDDRACPAIPADVESFLARAGELLLVQTVFSAPDGGLTRCVLYEGAHGPQQVDWMIWPRSVAVLHPPARILFVRAPIHAVATERYETLVDQPAGTAGPGHDQATCWLFVFIAARYLVRGWDSAVIAMLRGCAQVAARMGVAAALPAIPKEVEAGAAAGGLLRAFAVGLQRVVPGSRLEGDFASPEAVSAIVRFVKIISSTGGNGDQDGR